MRDSVLRLNVDICVELFTLGLNDAAFHTISQLIASLLKSKLAQIDHRCLLINIQRVDEIRAADRFCTLVISDLNRLRRLCRCLFLQLDSNCAILFNIIVLLCAIVVSSCIGRNVCMDGLVGNRGSQTIDSDIDKRAIDCLNTDQVVDMHGLIRHTRDRLVRHAGATRAASQNTGSSHSQSSHTCALEELTTRNVRHKNQPHNLFCMPRSLFVEPAFPI